MSEGQVVQIETRKRGFFGALVKWTFILFNILMLVWLIGGMNAATEGMETMSGAEQVGAAIGTGIGAFMIMTIWTIGDVILGIMVLLTRGKRIIVTQASE